MEVRDPHVRVAERMLAIVDPDDLDAVEVVCDKWGLATAIVATLEPGGDLDVRLGGATIAKVPALSLTEKAPVYERPIRAVATATDDPTFLPSRAISATPSARSLAAPNVASKRWVFEQYDRMVQGQTVAGPGSDAAIRARAGDDARARDLGRRQRPVREPGSVPGRRPCGRRGHEERRDDRRASARDHELPEFRRSGATRGDVAVRGGRARTARRVRRPRDAGHGRQRELLQRVRRLRDLADAGRRGPGGAADHRLRVPRRSPSRAVRLPPRGFLAELGGSEFAEAVLGIVAGAAGASTCWSNAGSSTSWWRPRLPISSPRRTTAPTGASAWRSPSARSARPRLRRHAAGRPPGPRAPVRRVGVASRRVGLVRARAPSAASPPHAASRSSGSGRRAVLAA